MDVCPKCGTTFQQAGNTEDGYVRSICECEHSQKCFKCKRGQYQPVNQALLDLDGDVRNYACARHGHIEAEEFRVPETPIGEKPKTKTTVVVVPAEKLTPPPSLPAKPPLNERSGMEVLDHGWTVTKWSETKRAALEDLKDPRNKYSVLCTNAECKLEHSYGKRKIEADDGKHILMIVCPKCGHTGYRIL